MPTLLLVGDSHSVDLARTLKPLFEAAGWTFANYGNVGKSVAWYEQQPIIEQLLAQHRPQTTLVVLGTNPSGPTPPRFRQQVEGVLHKLSGTRVVWIGPPTLKDASDDAESVARTKILAATSGITFLDGRSMTYDLPRTGDGVHFTQAGYKAWAERIHQQFTAPQKAGIGWKIAMVLLAIGTTLLIWRHH